MLFTVSKFRESGKKLRLGGVRPKCGEHWYEIVLKIESEHSSEVRERDPMK